MTNLKNFILLICCLLLFYPIGKAQLNRVQYNNKPVFFSGLNLAWNNFSDDLSNFDEDVFIKALDEISAAGGNCMRWWIHVDGTHSPNFRKGKVTGIKANEIETVRRVLDLAEERNIAVCLCLWSFDMLQGKKGVKHEQNKNLLQDTAYTNAYINKALLPMVKSLKGHPGIMCWEIFNEPEGMTEEFGWTPARTQMKYVQQFVNLCAGAIHREAAMEKVSNGSWSFKASSDVNGHKNYYKDSELLAAGGDSLGYLDFYMVHYYDWGGEELSPFHHPASYWQLNKPLVIAEFSAMGPMKDISAKQAYKFLYENNYAGALSWTWTNHDGHGGVEDAKPGMQLLFNEHKEAIELSK